MEKSNLTANQVQIWLAQNLLPEVPVFNLAVGLRLNGAVDVERFQQAFSVLVASSDALRTVVEERGGVPRQRVLAHVRSDTEFIDFSSLPDADERARRLLEARCRHPLSWNGRLFDSVLIRLADEHFIWYLNAHHLICDGWSFDLIYRTMADLYRRACEGRLPQSLDLPRFADYILYEQSHRASPRYRKTEEYWKAFLARAGDRVDFYGKVPAVMTTGVRRLSHDLGPERTRRIKSAAQALAGEAGQAGLFDLFAAVLIGYLDCLNGHESYTIGVPFHNRRSGFKETIGFFSEVLPVRVQLDEHESFASLVRKFNGEVRRTLRYGQYAVTNPLFKRVYDVTLNFHTRSFADFAGIPARPEWIHSGHGDETLAVQIHDFASAENLVADFDLHDAVFEERDGERVVAHYLRVLDVLLDNPELPLRRLSLATDEETHRLIAPCALPRPSSETRLVYEMFEERVREHPERLAVLCGEESVTYRELERRAAAVARGLKARGLKPRETAAIYLTRSPAMIAAILGVLKAGAAYVPIDPNHSSNDWLKFILDDTSAPLLLTEQRLLAGLPETRATVVCLDGDEDEVHGADDRPDAMITADDLAYVIYTSGSTGTPKGVQVTHGAMANFSREAARYFELNPTDRVLQFASIGFDTSAEEIFPCLIRAAGLVLYPGSIPSAATELLELCRASQVTVLDLPTAYWHELTSELFSERRVIPDSIRLVIIGGERAIPERLALWQAFVAGKARLLNTYGPTEATVAATIADLTHFPAPCGGAGQVPIGRPLGNVCVLILDRNLRPVPEGVPGEIYIGGAGLARGYIGQAALTAEKFIPNPFGQAFGSRLYRTGDMARWREDGGIEFLYRCDDQVKIRGFRVELGGVNAVLRQHPLIRDAAVLNEALAGSERLVAYVVPDAAGALNLKDVQDFVRSRLPEYMVPGDLVSLEALPMTSRGKLDRHALRKARVRPPETHDNLARPQTAVEERIARHWREILALDFIGRDQHFFEIGGHSLLAAQTVSRISHEFGIDVPLRAIFEAPTIASLAERVEAGLREDKLAQETAPVPLGSYNGHVPASDSQSRIWFMDRLAPESSAYNITAAIRFTGTLDREALQYGLDQLIERHEALRTSVTDDAGAPVQVIAPALRLELPEIDLRSSPPEERLDECRRVLREEGRRPFDLSRPPLLRVLLLQLDDRDHVLFLCMHHLISDQWSLAVIAREISASYKAYRNGGAVPAGSRTVQYGDFAMWQNRRLPASSQQADLAYWKRQLAGMQPAAVPSDRPRPAVQTFNGRHRTLPLSEKLIAGLKRIALAENATLYMVFLAAFKVLLSRYSNREDVALGSPVANRNRPEWEGVIGTFINLLVLRSNLGGNPSMREIVRRVRDVVLDAFTHQEAPFHKLVEELAPGRDASRSPLVQILFNYQSAPVGNVDFEGISWAPLEIEQWASQFDLSVTVDPAITRKVFLSYNTDLYDAETVARFLKHYMEVLEAMAADPEQSLATLALRVGAGKHQDSSLSYPEVCFHQLFEGQAAQTPDRVALVYEDRQFTYGELNARANHLANRLRRLGVAAETRVGVFAERSPDLVAGLLAIAKAGGAYVPIDPAYPRERVALILQDSAVAALISQNSLLPQLPQNDLPILCLDETVETEAVETANPEPITGPDNLAYVIYTSGSTGRPKGVQIPHRALVSFLASMQQRPGIGASDVLLSVTTISFDIAALELFLPLITGARVVIASRESAADGRALMGQLDACNASVMQATPTTWRMMMEWGWRGTSRLKVICGGERLPTSLARHLCARAGSVWNLYGPTETTVWSSIWAVDPDCDRSIIGQPIHNTQIHILDDNMLPLPVGVEGEIYIGGEGLARGYLNRSELTAERFVPNPYGAPGARLYRTGDVGRYLSDGKVEFIGRTDNQVKLRGFRIELGEIEAVLALHKDVKQAVVVVKGEDGDKRLVAHVVRHDDRSIAAHDLGVFVKQRLPSYMVPSVWVFLRSLPLTPNGKIDRSALARREDETSVQEPHAGPADRLEFELTHLWKQCLGSAAVGPHDNFFDRGGDSLRAVSLVAQIEKRFGETVRLVDFLADPTVAGVASLLRQSGCTRGWSFLFPVETSGSKPPFFWVHGDGSNFLLPAYLQNRPVFGFMHQSQDGMPARYTTVEEIAARYLQELCSVQPEGPYFIGGYSFGGLIAFEMAQQLRTRGEAVALLALLEATIPGNVAERTRSVMPQTNNLGIRVGRHVAALHGLSTGAKLAYSGAKARSFLKRLSGISTVRRAVKRAVYRFCERSGRVMPRWVRTAYIINIYGSAARRYNPGVYSGSVVFFKGLENAHDYRGAWRRLIAGEFRFHEVPGDHARVLQEPHARLWAKTLDECLNEAEAARSVERVDDISAEL